MSVALTFQLSKQQDYQIFSIITDLETSKIDRQLIEDSSDYVYYSQGGVEQNLPYIKDIVEQNQLQVCAVINGIDSGLYYADYLHNALVGFPKLDLDFSAIRLNKYQVNKALAEKNIRIISSVGVESIQDLCLKHEDILKLGWPMVAKPSENTAAMAGFAVLNSFEELEKYVEKVIGSKNSYYKVNIDKIILQEYLPMDQYNEYAIDFVSYDGQHYLQGLSTYGKELINDKHHICRNTRALLPNEVNNIAPVIEYMKSILTALNVSFGFTHNEVFWDGKDRFYLIESNNRLIGSGTVDQYAFCYGYTPFHALLNLIGDRKSSPQPLQNRLGYALVMKLYNFSTINPTTINLLDIKSQARITSFYPDKMIAAPFDDYTRADCIAANLLLTNESQEELDADIAELLKREREHRLFI